VDGHAVLSPHVGDMENAETLEAFTASVDHFCRLFHAEPARYVCDAHPGYLSSRWAEDAAAGRLLRVQHHHAHAASLMAEYGLGMDEELLTFCFDGTGYGTDGAIWGGEVLGARYSGFRRLAHLAYAPLPGGDSAARRPARLALAYLERAGVPWDERLAPVEACRASERRLLADQLRSGAAVVPTSSMGRLFDVVSSLAGICQHATYEGQAAMALEAAASGAAASSSSRGRYRFSLDA
jgi:hydrogenase maturation protein HypF